MKIDILSYRLFITLVKKEKLPKVEVCPYCGSRRIQFKRTGPLGYQKGRCLDCGRISYRREFK